MTPEDLDQIRALMREEIAAIEQRTNARVDRTMEALTANLSDVRNELLGAIEQLRIRLDTLEHRLDGVFTMVSSIRGEIGNLARQTDRFERDTGAILGNQAAHQRAFDALVARVAKLERELHPEQQ